MGIHNRTKQAGFTLVELVVVIIILGILAAVALPKFMDVTEKAHYSAVAGAAGGLGSGVALFHAQWVANGNTGAQVNIAGFGSDDVDANANGWPVDTGDTTNAPNAQDCEDVWYGVMQTPPSADTAVGTDPDYLVTVAAGVCTYTYRLDNANARSITYNSNTGEVSTINPKP